MKFTKITLYYYYYPIKRRRRRTWLKEQSNIDQKFIVNTSLNFLKLTFLSILAIFYMIDCILIQVVSTSSSSLSSSNNDTNFPCSSFKMNYSFDFAFNQILSVNDFHSSTKLYNHLIYSQKKFFKLYFDHNDELLIESIEFQTLPNDNYNLDDYLSDFDGDYGFSLHMTKPMTSKICTGRINNRFINCIDLYYRNITYAFIKQKETHLFELSDNFRPSFAFQHVGYDHFDASRFMIIFVEQKLLSTSIVNEINMPKQRQFQRRMQVYSFSKMERIVNLTYSAIVPNYLDEIPTEFEITGIFGWTRKNTNNDEFMAIVFNGTDHLYCMNEECSNAEYYKKFLSKCRAPDSLIALNQQSLNPKYKQQGLVVTKCCGQWEEFYKNNNNNGDNNENDDDESQWQFRDGKLYRVRSARSTNLNYVIWSLIILSLLIMLLIICWIYSCINESKYNYEQQRQQQQQSQYNNSINKISMKNNLQPQQQNGIINSNNNNDTDCQENDQNVGKLL